MTRSRVFYEVLVDLWGLGTQGAWVWQSVTPASEAALGVDDLPGDPAGLIGEQPGDEARGVVGLAPTPLGEHGGDRLAVRVGDVAGVDGAGVDRVDGDTGVDELLGDGQGDAGDGGLGGLGGSVGDLPGQGSQALTGGEEDDGAAAAPEAG